MYVNRCPQARTVPSPRTKGQCGTQKGPIPATGTLPRRKRGPGRGRDPWKRALIQAAPVLLRGLLEGGADCRLDGLAGDGGAGNAVDLVALGGLDLLGVGAVLDGLVAADALGLVVG